MGILSPVPDAFASSYGFERDPPEHNCIVKRARAIYSLWKMKATFQYLRKAE